MGEITRTGLAREYNRADIFCLPSVQEGFGIVFLEAMAAGKAIVAARAAAVPEVVRRGVLVEPESAEDLACGISKLFQYPEFLRTLARQQLQDVEEYDVMCVSRLFMEEVETIMHQKAGRACKIPV